MRSYWIILCITTSLSAAPEWAHYAPILNKDMFGSNAKSIVKAPPKTAPKASAGSANWRLCALTRKANGTIQVGIVGLKDKTKNLLLKVEETIDGVKVINANIEDGTATISENSQEFMLDMKTAYTSTATKTSTSSSNRSSDRGNRGSRPDSRNNNDGSNESFMDRRREMIERHRKMRDDEGQNGESDRRGERRER